MRYLTPRVRRDLARKMVLLAGPRQCGKTTLAKSLLDERGVYLNWDIVKDRRLIRNRRVQWLIEVKVSDGAVSPSLAYYARRLNPDESLQLVLNLERAEERSGIKVLPLGRWLEALPFETRIETR